MNRGQWQGHPGKPERNPPERCEKNRPMGVRSQEFRQTRDRPHVFRGLADVGGPAGGEETSLDQTGPDDLTGRIDAADLEKLGEVLKTAASGLVIVFSTRMADRIAAAISPKSRYVSGKIDADVQELDAQLGEAEHKSG